MLRKHTYGLWNLWQVWFVAFRCSGTFSIKFLRPCTHTGLYAHAARERPKWQHAKKTLTLTTKIRAHANVAFSLLFRSATVVSSWNYPSRLLQNRQAVCVLRPAFSVTLNPLFRKASLQNFSRFALNSLVLWIKKFSIVIGDKVIIVIGIVLNRWRKMQHGKLTNFQSDNSSISTYNNVRISSGEKKAWNPFEIPSNSNTFVVERMCYNIWDNSWENFDQWLVQWSKVIVSVIFITLSEYSVPGPYKEVQIYLLLYNVWKSVWQYRLLRAQFGGRATWCLLILSISLTIRDVM